MHRAILYGGSSEKENLYNPIIRLTWRSYMIAEIILTATAVSLRVFMAAIVPSASADKCKGYSSSEMLVTISGISGLNKDGPVVYTATQQPE